MAFVRYAKHARWFGLLTVLALTGFLGSVFAAGQAGSPTAAPHILPRIFDAVDEAKLVSLPGQTHPLAAAKYDEGAVSDSLPMEHMYLCLLYTSRCV